MLVGRFEHNIDLKGRVFMPAKLREELGDGFIATKGKDPCICVYSKEQWKRLEEKMLALPSKYDALKRFFFASANVIEIDKQGRISLPLELRQYAGLSQTATITGVGDKVEIWNPDRYQRADEDMTPEKAALLMESLGI